MNAHRYERITFQGEKRKQSVILRDPVDGPSDLLFRWPTVRGTEVNKYGEEIAPLGIDERFRVISLSLVTARVPLHWNNKYAELEA